MMTTETNTAAFWGRCRKCNSCRALLKKFPFYSFFLLKVKFSINSQKWRKYLFFFLHSCEPFLLPFTFFFSSLQPPTCRRQHTVMKYDRWKYVSEAIQKKKRTSSVIPPYSPRVTAAVAFCGLTLSPGAGKPLSWQQTQVSLRGFTHWSFETVTCLFIFTP